MRVAVIGLGYACVLGAVAHAPYRALSAATFASMLAPGGLVADIKNMWRSAATFASMLAPGGLVADIKRHRIARRAQALDAVSGRRGGPR